MNDEIKHLEAMIAILQTAKYQMQIAQRGIESHGLSLDADRAYDGLREAEDQLQRCIKAAKAVKA